MWNAVEHLACGAGLVNIYDFLRVMNPSGRPQSQLQQERDPPSVGKGAMLVSASSVNKHPYQITPFCPSVPPFPCPTIEFWLPPEPLSALITVCIPTLLSYRLASSMCCQVWIDALTSILQCLLSACLMVVMPLRPWLTVTHEYLTAE